MDWPTNETQEKFEKSRLEALTSIRGAYTLAATANVSEVEGLMIRHFIETLAEVALSVASRKAEQKEQA